VGRRGGAWSGVPITSDLDQYLVQAHEFTDLGANPLQEAPATLADDPLWKAYPSAYVERPSVYGPTWALLSAPATLGRYDVAWGFFYLKALAAASFLGCAWLLERLLRALRPEAALEGLYLFAWNPLVVWMAVGEGHNDVVMMALVLLGLWWAQRERWALACGALALSMGVKYVSALFVPLVVLYAWRQGERGARGNPWPILARGALGAALVSALVLLPFGPLTWIGGAAERFVEPVNPTVEASRLVFWGLRVGLLAFGVFYAGVLLKAVRGRLPLQDCLDAAFAVALGAFVFGAARSQPWHLLWPAALAGLASWRRAWPVVAALSALMLVAQVWVEWGTPGL
jgi:hypothetical protein